MKAYGYLCVGGTEVINDDRMATYIRNGLVNAAGYNAYCESCDAIVPDTPYSDPSVDGAPWFDVNFWDSADFLGVLPTRIDLIPANGRTMNGKAGDGGVLGPLRLGPKVIQVEALLVAGTEQGMAYGTDWLREVLAGSYCADGCEGDEVVYLPVCPTAGYDPPEQAFRQLVGAGLVDLTPPTPLGNFPEAKLSQVTFQLASEEGYVFGLGERIMTHTLPGSVAAASSTTPDWVDGAVFKIEVTNDGLVDATNVTIEGRISLDGSCPVTGTASSVPPSWSYTIPTLGPGDRLVIDGRKRKVTYYDASCKTASAGLSKVTFTGPWKNPEVGPCTTMCIEAGIGAGTVDLTIDNHLRWK